MIKLPGLIDIHVHLRDPGQTYKEDFFTGTSAALAGGFTTIIDMPNNIQPLVSLKVLNEKIKSAMAKAVCDIGFYFGSRGDNIIQFEKIKDKVFGLKLYLNQTTGNLLIDKKNILKVYKAWFGQLILVHVEDDKIEEIFKAVKKTGKNTHICHVHTKYILNKIIKAKKSGLPITCGVTPHHLFLTKDDLIKLGPFGLMKPELQTKKDQEFLWKNLKYIDVIESDHAPHDIEEKISGKPLYGVPELETTLPLLMTAVSQKRLKIDRLIELCFENPKKIFNIITDKNTYIEIDPDEEYIIDNKNLKTKCGWSPFAGWKVKGKLKRVFLRGKKVFEDGKILVKAGTGGLLIQKKYYEFINKTF